MKKIKTLLLGILCAGSFAPLCAETVDQNILFEQFNRAADLLIEGSFDPEVMVQWSPEERGVIRHVLLAKRDGLQEGFISSERAEWLNSAQKISGGAILATGFLTSVLCSVAAHYQSACTMASLFSEFGSKEFAQEYSSIATKASAKAWKWFAGTALSGASLCGIALYSVKVTQEIDQAQAADFLRKRVGELVDFIDQVDQNS